MHIFCLSNIIVVALFTVLNLAVPIIPASSTALSPRSPLCANVPLSGIQSRLDRSNFFPSTLQARKETNTVLWKAPRSETYVILTMRDRIGGNAVCTLLDMAYIVASTHIKSAGDGVIANGMFEMTGENGLLLRIWNSNNHQTTYGVLSAACMALVQYMTVTAFGSVSFHIFDGVSEVGQGELN